MGMRWLLLLLLLKLRRLRLQRGSWGLLRGCWWCWRWWRLLLLLLIPEDGQGHLGSSSGPPPQSHGSAQKCPSWGRAAWIACSTTPPQATLVPKMSSKESQASAPPPECLGSSPLSLACSGSLGLPGVQTLPQECMVLGREGGREGLEKEEEGKELCLRWSSRKRVRPGSASPSLAQ